jgi:hypothetical protein
MSGFWARRLLVNSVSRWMRAGRMRPRKPVPVRLTVEQLEKRELLSSSPAFAGLSPGSAAEGGAPLTRTVTGTHGDGTATVVGNSIFIKPFGGPVLTVTVNAPNATEGTSTGTFTVATFSDTNTSEAASNFTAVIQWGDGTSSTILSFNGLSGGNGNFVIRSAHTYFEESNTPTVIAVTVFDATGPSASGNSPNFAVADAPLTLTAVNAVAGLTEGQGTGTFTVATFTDGNGDAPATDFTAVVQWGDGSTSTVSGSGIVATGGGSFAVLASHTYEEANGTLAVQVSDVGGSNVAGTHTIAVADAALSNLTITPIQATEAKGTGLIRVASFHDSNRLAPATDFTATITWGDGSTSTVSGAAGNIVALSNGNFALMANHTYAEEGSFTLSVQVRDDGGSSASAARGLRVADTALASLALVNPHATEGKGTGTFTVATFVDKNAAAPATDFTAVVHWGDGTTSTVSGGGIVSEGGGKFAVRASHTYAESGSYALSLKLLDDGGASVSGSLTISVADAPLGSLSVQNPHATVGHSTGTFTVATFHDNNLVAPTSDFTAVIHWGDGTSSTLTTSDFVSLGNGNFALLASHTYGETGVLTLSVLIDDVGSASVSGNLKISVA